MLLITCPFCGPRDEIEYRCGGESHIVRPQLAATDKEWAEYLYSRKNPRGVHFERWVHVAGCGLWFNVARDTVTHEMCAIYAMGDAKPDIAP